MIMSARNKTRNRLSTSKPVRLLSNYHLFFQLERAFLLQCMPKDSRDDNASENYTGHRQYGYEIDVQMPARYKFILLSPFWYMSASGKRMKTFESEEKRQHKRGRGKISFLELSCLVSTRWATLEQTCPEKVYVQTIYKRGEFF